MKKLLFALCLLFTAAVSAQIPHPGYAPKVFAYGLAFNRAVFDSALHIPNKPCLCTLDNDTTPQLFVFADTLRLFANSTFRNVTGGGGGGGSYTADESSLHLTGSVFSIKSTWVGQTSITQLGTITTGIWNSTAIADAYIASSATWNAKQTSTLTSAKLWIGNASNIATEQSLSGDATLNNTGALTLASVVGAGSCTACNITFDAKGRATAYTNGSAGAGAPFSDNAALVKNNSDNTRLLIFDASLVATGTTRTWKFPNVNGTVARIDAAQTFTGLQTFTNGINLTSASTTGYVWMATDNAGNGAWTSLPAGSGITALTGDGTASGTGSVPFTLATVNGNVGTFGDATHVSVITLNGKGLATAASSVAINAVNTDATQTYTSGATLTVTNGNNYLFVNPATVQATLTVTLPATWHNSGNLYIVFGGTIASGNPVITSFSVNAGSGQTLVQAVTPSGTMNAGEVIQYHLNGTNDNRIL